MGLQLISFSIGKLYAMKRVISQSLVVHSTCWSGQGRGLSAHHPPGSSHPSVTPSPGESAALVSSLWPLRSHAHFCFFLSKYWTENLQKIKWGLHIYTLPQFISSFVLLSRLTFFIWKYMPHLSSHYSSNMHTPGTKIFCIDQQYNYETGEIWCWHITLLSGSLDHLSALYRIFFHIGASSVSHSHML